MIDYLSCAQDFDPRITINRTPLRTLHSLIICLLWYAYVTLHAAIRGYCSFALVFNVYLACDGTSLMGAYPSTTIVIFWYARRGLLTTIWCGWVGTLVIIWTALKWTISRTYISIIIKPLCMTKIIFLTPIIIDFSRTFNFCPRTCLLTPKFAFSVIVTFCRTYIKQEEK